MLKKEKLKKLFTEVIKNVLKKLSINMVHLADFMVDRKKNGYTEKVHKKEYSRLDWVLRKKKLKKTL